MDVTRSPLMNWRKINRKVLQADMARLAKVCAFEQSLEQEKCQRKSELGI